MSEYRIVFKNGRETIVSKGIAEALNTTIVSPEGCKPIQSYSDSANNNEFICLVNILDISFIEKVKT